MKTRIDPSIAAGIHRDGLYVLLAAVAVQLALAGGGAFGAPAWGMHGMLGMLIATLAIVLVVAAVVARSDRTLLIGSLAVGGLAMLQPALSILAQRADPWFGMLHALGAGVIFATVAILALSLAQLGADRRTSRVQVP